MFSETNEFFKQCRCCLEDINNSEESISEICELFEILTKIKLVSSPFLSTIICQECSDQFKKISSFSQDLITKQQFLLESLNEKQEDVKEEFLRPDTVAEPNTGNMIQDTSLDSCTLELEEPAVLKSRITKRSTKRKKPELPDYRDNTCPLCGKKFTEKRKIALHIKRIHTKIKDFSCDQCNYAAYTKFDIVRHKKNIHTPPTNNQADKRICPHCGKVVRGNNQLTLHIRKKHLLIKKFNCDLCSFASYGKYEIRSHLEHVHIPKEFKESYACTFCESVLSSAAGLRIHVQHKHSGLKPYECFCGKSFSLRETLKTHVRNVHKGERKYPCKFCPKRFGQAVRLRDHINNNHGQKQEIPCLQCSKIFHSKRNLHAHMVYHDEPKFVCHCGKKFYLSNKLKEHLKVHEGADIFCKICNRSFQLQSSLKRHLKSHQA